MHIFQKSFGLQKETRKDKNFFGKIVNIDKNILFIYIQIFQKGTLP